MSTQCNVLNEIVPCECATMALDGFEREVSLRRATELGPLAESVSAALDSLGYSPPDCMSVRLVLEEAVVNGLRHGNGGDPSKQVRVRYRVSGEAVLIDVEDEGPGFNPDLVPDPTLPENLGRPCGRGLFLMRRYTTWMRHSACGRRVTFYKAGSV